MRLMLRQSFFRLIVPLLFLAVATIILPGCGKKSKADQQAHEPEVKHHSVTLSWMSSKSKSPVIGYNLYRADSPGGIYIKLNSAPLQTTTYTDTTVEAGHSYIYSVTAVNSKNVESSPSTVASATVPKP